MVVREKTRDLSAKIHGPPAPKAQTKELDVSGSIVVANNVGIGAVEWDRKAKAPKIELTLSNEGKSALRINLQGSEWNVTQTRDGKTSTRALTGTEKDLLVDLLKRYPALRQQTGAADKANGQAPGGAYTQVARFIQGGIDGSPAGALDRNATVRLKQLTSETWAAPKRPVVKAPVTPAAEVLVAKQKSLVHAIDTANSWLGSLKPADYNQASRANVELLLGRAEKELGVLLRKKSPIKASLSSLKAKHLALINKTSPTGVVSPTSVKVDDALLKATAVAVKGLASPNAFERGMSTIDVTGGGRTLRFGREDGKWAVTPEGDGRSRAAQPRELELLEQLISKQIADVDQEQNRATLMTARSVLGLQAQTEVPANSSETLASPSEDEHEIIGGG
jgi:hypothetical protein